jgi:hypothetical protein
VVVPFTFKVPVSSEVVFPQGAMFMGVDAQTDFDLRGRAEDDQARDKETGERLWTVTVIDLEEPEATRFRRSAELKVRVVSAVRPAPPPASVPGYPPLVAFEGLTLTPYLDQTRCVPRESGLCRARQAYSLRASRMVPYTDDTAGDGGGDGPH